MCLGLFPTFDILRKGCRPDFCGLNGLAAVRETIPLNVGHAWCGVDFGRDFD
jgi:hypothetical protein